MGPLHLNVNNRFDFVCLVVLKEQSTKTCFNITTSLSGSLEQNIFSEQEIFCQIKLLSLTWGLRGVKSYSFTPA